MAGGHVIGVDGGGSKTLALLADSDGTILGRGRSGPSNYQAVGTEAAFAAVQAAAGEAWKDAGLEQGPLAAVCMGLAGAGRPEDHKLIQAWGEDAFPGARITIVNDAHLALAAGTPAQWGLAVISGTGSLIYGCDRQGKSARAGGWGYLFGDEGSGYAIGLRALRAVAQASDGRGPVTALTDLVLSAWQLQAPGDLVRHVYRSMANRIEIGELAVLVEQAAGQRGDTVAMGILTEAGKDLALGASTVAQKLRFEGEVPCALAGGSLVKGTLLGKAFLRATEEYGLRLRPVQKVAEPALGAVRIACTS